MNFNFQSARPPNEESVSPLVPPHLTADDLQPGPAHGRPASVTRPRRRIATMMPGRALDLIIYQRKQRKQSQGRTESTSRFSRSDRPSSTDRLPNLSWNRDYAVDHTLLQKNMGNPIVQRAGIHMYQSLVTVAVSTVKLIDSTQKQRRIVYDTGHEP